MRSLKDQLNWSHCPTKILLTISNARYSEQVRDTLRKRCETARRRTEIEAIDGRRRMFGSGTKRKRRTQRRATERDGRRPPITVAFVFQPSKAEGNPCRQSGISISSRDLHWRFSWNCLTTKKREKRCAVMHYTSCQSDINLNRIYFDLQN